MGVESARPAAVTARTTPEARIKNPSPIRPRVLVLGRCSAMALLFVALN